MGSTRIDVGQLATACQDLQLFFFFLRENLPYLPRQIVTGDEKWVLYFSRWRKHQWVDRDQQPEPEPKGGPPSE